MLPENTLDNPTPETNGLETRLDKNPSRKKPWKKTTEWKPRKNLRKISFKKTNSNKFSVKNRLKKRLECQPPERTTLKNVCKKVLQIKTSGKNPRMEAQKKPRKKPSEKSSLEKNELEKNLW